jgi:hypothetical protein
MSCVLLPDPSTIAATELLPVLDFTFVSAMVFSTVSAGVMCARAVIRNMGGPHNLALEAASWLWEELLQVNPLALHI